MGCRRPSRCAGPGGRPTADPDDSRGAASPDPQVWQPSAPNVSATTGSAIHTAQAAVDAVVPALMSGRPADSVSIVGTDPTSGATVRWGARTVVPAASVFKLTLLECYLLSNQERGQQPGYGAPDALTAMIENSDNDAADRVYAALGGDNGVSSRMGRLDLSATVLGPVTNGGCPPPLARIKRHC
ncbi:MAG: Beta-lactamase class [Blastococcus sp.]|nr:Beta-lactamase class [Blastococcus sp.]